MRSSTTRSGAWAAAMVTHSSPSLAEARELMEGFVGVGTPGPEMASVDDRTVPGPGGEIPVRVYLPAAETPRAGLVYFHGGGWVIGSIRTHDATCRHLAHVSGAA